MKENRFTLELIDPNPDNPRTIKDAQYRKAMRSVAQFPQMLAVRGLAIVVQETGRAIVLGGNQRLSVLKDLQKKHSKKAAFLAEFETTAEAWEVLADYYGNGIPFHDCTGMTEEQRKRFIIADNVDFGDWDADALGNWDSGDLTEWGVDIGGFWVEQDYSNKNKEIDVSKFSDLMELKFKFDKQTYHEVKDILMSMGETIEDGLLKLLENAKP